MQLGKYLLITTIWYILTAYKLLVPSFISLDTQYCNACLKQESWKTEFQGKKTYNPFWKKTPLTLAFTAFRIYSMLCLFFFLNKSVKPYVLFCNLCFNDSSESTFFHMMFDGLIIAYHIDTPQFTNLGILDRILTCEVLCRPKSQRNDQGPSFYPHTYLLLS